MPDDDYEKMQLLEGMSAFNSARIRAFWSEVYSLIRGKPVELLSFEEVRARLRLREESYMGLQDVPLDKIVGSVGRYREFTRSFLPKTNTLRERWSRVYAQTTGLMGLPPIELYKIGDVFFVRDGNHRVSVARQMGAGTIQAHVTELPTSITVHPGMSDEELEDAALYAEFLDLTRLGYSRPHHQPARLSEPSRYADLLGHINLQRAVMEETEKRPVPIEEASAKWYDEVYRPAVTLIRKYNVLDKDSKRTEADVYLWMIDHMREVRQQAGEEPARTRRFSDALVDYLSARRIPVPKDLLTEKDITVELTRADLDRLLAEQRARDQQPPDSDSTAAPNGSHAQS